MWQLNHTSDWMKSLTPDRRAELMEKARLSVPDQRAEVGNIFVCIKIIVVFILVL
jgi:hypothetical protein